MGVLSFYFPDDDTPQQTDDSNINPVPYPESVHQKLVSGANPSKSVVTAVPKEEGALFRHQCS